VLPRVAGAVNASGFLAIGVYTSHVTGLIARVGDEWAQQRQASAIDAATLVAMFLVGAMVATALIEAARNRTRARYVVPLLLQAVMLAVFAALARTGVTPQAAFALASILCFAMGLQNALVTRISGAVVRTTHMTGIVTDIGIELVRLLGWLRQRLFHFDGLRRQTRILRLLSAGRPWRKLRLRLMIFSSFVTGAIVGPRLSLRFGQPAMLIPICLLLVLAAGDLLWGIRTGLDRSRR
jgi:uncharacterized membrane protein YoaK (UPF0700 family)